MLPTALGNYVKSKLLWLTMVATLFFRIIELYVCRHTAILRRQYCLNSPELMPNEDRERLENSCNTSSALFPQRPNTSNARRRNKYPRLDYLARYFPSFFFSFSVAAKSGVLLPERRDRFAHGCVMVTSKRRFFPSL